MQRKTVSDEEERNGIPPLLPKKFNLTRLRLATSAGDCNRGGQGDVSNAQSFV